MITLLPYLWRTLLTFNDNNAGVLGEAICFNQKCGVINTDRSIVIFQNNSAEQGGAVYFNVNSYLASKENSMIKFTANSAFTLGGAIYCEKLIN